MKGLVLNTTVMTMKYQGSTSQKKCSTKPLKKPIELQRECGEKGNLKKQLNTNQL